MKTILFIILWLAIIPLNTFGQTAFEQAVEERIGYELSAEEAASVFPEAIPEMESYEIKERIGVKNPGVWLWVEKNTGVCHTEWIYVFSSEGKLQDELLVTSLCDHDGSSAVMKSRKGKWVGSEPIIEVRHEEQWVADSSLYQDATGYLHNPNILKKGYSFHDDGMTFRVVRYAQYYRLDGEKSFQLIVEDTSKRAYRDYPFTHHRLLQEKDLASYSKAELRIMRNEIFADYGYRFLSKELQAHFDQKDWYEPRFSEISVVSPKLNLLERKNVETIRATEKKR